MKRTLTALALIIMAAGSSGEARQTRAVPKVAGSAVLSADGVKAIDELGVELAKLVDSQRKLSETAAKLEELCAKLAKAGENVGKAVEPAEKGLVYIRTQAGGNELAALVKAAKDFEEATQSFNLQYLGLQQRMQDENRRFSLLSNIMKTKHDTAKNSINNIR